MSKRKNPETKTAEIQREGNWHSDGTNAEIWKLLNCYGERVWNIFKLISLEEDSTHSHWGIWNLTFLKAKGGGKKNKGKEKAFSPPSFR